jgi:pyruvate/2-oxoglutarate dehydrogenase complex dihydrolipoamide acyltransferase (E2) component
MVEVKMPQWGMNMTEGYIVEWLKRVGDRIEAGEPIVEIEAAKASNTIEAPVSGTLVKILVEADETVLVQTPIAIIEE